MKRNLVLALIIGLAIICSVISKTFDSKIGGNATNGYSEFNNYYVKNEEGCLTEVSKVVWYFNYVFSLVTAVLLVAASFSLFALFIIYVIIPIYNLNYKK